MRRSRHHDLLNVRTQALRPLPQGVAVDRHITPHQLQQPILGNGLLEQGACALAVRQVEAGQEDHAQGQVAAGRGLNLLLRQFPRNQLVRQLRQDAGAVSALAVGCHRAAMGMIAQGIERQPEDLMAARARFLRHKANAARIVFEARIVKRARDIEWER